MNLSAVRRTKIVCTIGPSSSDPDILRQMIDAGMNVARINFSHGSHEQHRQTVELIRRVEAEVDATIGILAHLQGPKIRTGRLVDAEPVRLIPGEAFCITTDETVGDAQKVSTTYQALPEDVQPGDCIYVADGLLELQVDRIDGSNVHCIVRHGGMLGEHKGINLPGVAVSAGSLTDKDRKDLEFIKTLDVDFVALSFVRRPEDIQELRELIGGRGTDLSIVAKIERPEAVARFDAILEVTDVVMLARGDLGVEVPLHEVPQIQKRIIGKCNDAGVPVITATQMLESMVASVRPTRAEVADVANAVYDGTDALMLSGETASGDYPIDAVRVMTNIAEEADLALTQHPSQNKIKRMRVDAIRRGKGAFGDAMAQAACRTAEGIGTKRIVCFTKLGGTAALIARFRPTVPVTAITLSDTTKRRCSLIWGVDATLSIEPVNTDDLDRVVDDVLLSAGLAAEGDVVVLVGGIPLAMRTRTNMVKLHTVGRAPEDVGEDRREA